MKKTFFSLLLSVSAIAVGQKLNLTKNQVAVSGYDLVTYFNNEAPLKGSESHALTLNDATFYFVSEQNKRTFKAAPEKYLPKYGGWCAYAMAKGKNVSVNPEAFLIDEGKLYLFYKTNWTNTRLKWLDDIAVLKPKADEYWDKKEAENK